MLNQTITVTLALQAGTSLLYWARRLGGLGLIVVGIIDNSAIPVAGSQDALTIFLAAGERQRWPYYALMATAGALAGGYLTYRLARKEGQAILEKRLSRGKTQKIYKTFEKWGFGAILLPALLPPPMPLFPFLLAAGAMQYSRTKFLSALALGRLMRYAILAFLAARYGGQILGWITEYGKPILFAGIAVGAAAGIYIFVRYKKSKRESHA
jgi:membrane protein YqaA with SNARE-associated domain